MNALGVSLIVGGIVFLFSGLLSLLPRERKLTQRNESIDESRDRWEYYLDEMRKQRGEL